MKEYTVKVFDDGRKSWFLNGKRHREDGPAIECSDGHKEWYLNGKRHREDGPAVEYANGSKEWYLNGKRHREDGPAIEWADGDKSWWLNGERHREDGPAIEGTNGGKEWYLNGKWLTEAQFNKRMAPLSECVITSVTIAVTEAIFATFNKSDTHVAIIVPWFEHHRELVKFIKEQLAVHGLLPTVKRRDVSSITFDNGSSIHLFGHSNYDSIRGMHFNTLIECYDRMPRDAYHSIIPILVSGKSYKWYFCPEFNMSCMLDKISK